MGLIVQEDSLAQTLEPLRDLLKLNFVQNREALQRDEGLLKITTILWRLGIGLVW